MALTTPEQTLARWCAGYEWQLPAYGEAVASRTNPLSGGGATLVMERAAWGQSLPGSLESGVTAYLPTRIDGYTTPSAPLLITETFLLGTYVVGTGFTDGVAMPTRTVFGASYQHHSPILMEVDGANMVGAPVVTVTFNDQGGTSRTSVAHTVTNNSVVGSTGVVVSTSTLDTGASDITNISATGGTSGTIKFWGVIPIHFIPSSPNNTLFSANLLQEGVCRRLPAGARWDVWLIGSLAAHGTWARMQVVGDT